MLEATKDKKNNTENETYVFQNNYLTENDEMRNIILRNDGRYMGRKQTGGQIITVYARNANECATKLKRAIKDALKNPKTKKVEYKLYDWLDNWYDTYKAPFISLDTAKKIARVIQHIKTHLENLNLYSLTTQIIQKYLNGIAQSRAKEFIVLYFNASLQKAEDLDIITKNPFKAVIKEQKLNNIRSGYTLEEQKIILQAIKNTDIEKIILLYLITGIRKGELATINLATDLDLKQKTLRIQSEKKRNSKNKYRYIDLTDNAIALIQGCGQEIKMNTDYIYRKLKTLLTPFGIETGLHRLRHTFATNHFYLGTPTKLVSSWLGHETVELTQNIYTHIDRTITKNDILKLYNNLYFQI